MTSSSNRSGPIAPTNAPAGRVAEFVAKANALRDRTQAGRARLVFALDATMSRQPTWDLACRLQGEMFTETGRIGGLDVQLVYFRGLGECKASRWVSDAAQLASLMTRIGCRGGNTQIARVLDHAIAETRRERIKAVVFVGDAMEEPIDKLCAKAGELALLGVPVFAFQEGRDQIAEQAFREIARVSRGAWCRFDASSAAELASLLRAVAAYAAGGRGALAALSERAAHRRGVCCSNWTRHETGRVRHIA